MYIKNGISYSDPGHYLIKGNAIGFKLAGSNPQEYPLDLTDAHISNGYFKFNKDLFSIKVIPGWKYADYKNHIIKWRYSNDDQIAIILNKDDSESDLMEYNRMMDWRSFAAKLALMISQ